MRIRVKQRRSLAGVLQYLHNPSPSVESDDVFMVASETDVRKLVFDPVKRLRDVQSSTKILAETDPPSSAVLSVINTRAFKPYVNILRSPMLDNVFYCIALFCVIS